VGSLEGTRANRALPHRIRTGSIVAIVAVATAFAVAIGDENTSLTIKNLTPHVVTVVVEQQKFPDLAPDGQATYRGKGGSTVHATVSYAPGQGVEGNVGRAFTMAAAASSSSGYVFWACSFNGGVTAPAPQAIFWNVTADTLAGGSEPGVRPPPGSPIATAAR
jgi:hypothetical protein